MVSSIIPKQVSILTNVVAVSAGALHSLALKSDSTVWSWGGDGDGQLGNNTTRATELTPVQVFGLDNVIAIATRYHHSLALKSDGTVWAWGLNNRGQLGDSTLITRATPRQVLALSDMIAIGTGDGHSVALKSDSTVWTWGDGGDGQLGDGTTNTNDTTPDPIAGFAGIIKIAVGGDHTLALKNDGTLWAWGLNGDHQLGNNTMPESNVPIQILSIPPIDSIAAGWYHSFALLTNGNVYAWGAGTNGELGNGGSSGSPFLILIPTLHNIKTLSGGDGHSIGLHQNGLVSVWGKNDHGQLGDSSITRKLIPNYLAGLCTQYEGIPNTTFTNYFRPTAAARGNWVAGELSSSIDLPDSKTMWLFGRSKIGGLDGGAIPCGTVHEVHNCLVLQDRFSPSNLETRLNPNSSLADSSFFQDSLLPSNYFIPGHGYLHDDSTAYIFLSRKAADGTFLGNTIRRLHKGITTWTLEDINRVVAPGDSTIDFGCAVLVEGNYVYAYGSKDSATIRLPYLARREFADTSAAWEYYASSAWTPNVADADPISTYNVAERYSVTKLQGRYYLISHERAPDTTTCSARRIMMVYRSDSLTGSFSEPALLYVAPDTIDGRFLQTFNAYAHLAPSGCDSLLVSYNVHDTAPNDCPVQCDSASTQNADTWRPKFISVPYTLIDAGLQPTLPPAANFNFSTAGNTVSLINNSTGSTAFLWDFGYGNTSTLTNPSHVFATTGHHPVTLIAFGCGQTADTTTIYVGPGVTEPFPSLGIFPNPSNGQFQLVARELGDEPITIEIFTSLGALCFSKTCNPTNGALDLLFDNMNPLIFEGAGIYLLRMHNAPQSATRVVIVGASH